MWCGFALVRLREAELFVGRERVPALSEIGEVMTALLLGGVLVDDRQVEGLVAVFAGQAGAGSGLA